MRSNLLWMMPFLIVLTGCSLAGDITPPADIASDQADSNIMPTDVFSSQEVDRLLATQAPESEINNPTKGTIVGVIENGTSGGSVPRQLEVNLVASDGQALAFSTKIEADEDGGFIFEGVEVIPGRIFLAYVDYRDVRYISNARHFSADEAPLDLSLQIYETTNDSSGLQISRLHLIFKLAGEGQIGVTQVWIISGLEDRTIIERDGVGVVDIRLPEGFSNLGIDDAVSPEGRYLLSDTGFIDRAPVQPGESRELVFGFNLPYESGLDYSQLMDYPVDAVVVLLVSDQLSVRAEGLEELGRRDMAGASMRSYSMGAFQSGEALELHLRSNIGFFGEDEDLIVILAGGILVVVVIVTVLSRLLRAWRKTRGDELPSGELYTDQKSLIEAIAALDDAFEGGEIPEDTYRSSRAKLKDQTLLLMRGDDD